MADPDLPLFRWRPPECQLIPFPYIHRVGKIRDTAVKYLDKPSERHRAYYRTQVTDAMRVQLLKINMDDSVIESEIQSFWQRVDGEITRICYQSGDPLGAA